MSVRRMTASFQASLRPPQESWFAAVREDDLETVVSLIATRTDPDGFDRTGNSALHLAAHKGAANVVTALLRCVKDVNSRNKESLTPLLVSAAAGHTQILATLLQDERTDKLATDDLGATALHLAAASYNPEAVTLVLRETPISVDASDEQGYTPLMYAARAGELLPTAALIDAGADPELRSRAGLSARDLADRFGHKLVSALLNKFLPKPALVPMEPEPQSIKISHSDSIPAVRAQTSECEVKTDPALTEILELLRTFHSTEENRSPEFAEQVKRRIDEEFIRLAGDVDGKLPSSALLRALPASIDERLIPGDSIDKRTFAILLTALATLPLIN